MAKITPPRNLQLVWRRKANKLAKAYVDEGLDAVGYLADEIYDSLVKAYLAGKG